MEKGKWRRGKGEREDEKGRKGEGSKARTLKYTEEHQLGTIKIFFAISWFLNGCVVGYHRPITPVRPTVCMMSLAAWVDGRMDGWLCIGASDWLTGWLAGWLSVCEAGWLAVCLFTFLVLSQHHKTQRMPHLTAQFRNTPSPLVVFLRKQPGFAPRKHANHIFTTICGVTLENKLERPEVNAYVNTKRCWFGHLSFYLL